MNVGQEPLASDDRFEAFFRAEYPKLLALGRALAPAAAHDLAQEALIRACRNWSAVADYDIPGAWVRRVMLRLVADHHRSLGRRERMVDRFRANSSPSMRDGTTGIDVDDDQWFDAVRALPARQASVVALHYIDQLSVAEVATILEIAPGTVKSSLSRARVKLARTLGARIERATTEVEQ